MPETPSLLRSVNAGDPQAAQRLLPAVYAELRGLAAALLNRGAGHITLQPTEIVHEAYVKLAGADAPPESTAHFRALAALAVRQTIVDQIRRRTRRKRGGGLQRVFLADDATLTGQTAIDAQALHDALNDFSRLDPRAAQVVELRFFGGLTERDVAEHLGLSERTVRNEWTIARAWLKAAIQDGGAG